MPDPTAPLFPGREVKLTDAASVMVFPVSFAHLKRFTEVLAKLLSAVVRNANDGTISVDAMTLLTVAPDETLTLVSACCRPSLDELNPPAWVLPTIVEAWLTESFLGEGKSRPLASLAGTLIERVTGQKIDASDLSGLLNALPFSLGRATRATTSLNTGNPVAPTPDGRSPNSAGGPPQPLANG